MDYCCTHIGVQANPWQDLHIIGQTLNLLQYHASGGKKKKSLCQNLSSFVSTISGILDRKSVDRIASGLAFKKKNLKKCKAQRPSECGILLQSEAISIGARRSLSLLHVTLESWIIKSPVSFRYEGSFLNQQKNNKIRWTFSKRTNIHCNRATFWNNSEGLYPLGGPRYLVW